MLASGHLFAYVNARRKGKAPATALELARAKPAACGYTKFYSPEGNVTRQPNRPRYAWIENTESAGLRFVDFADKIARSIRHRGWYTSDDGWTGETYRGVVYRLARGRGFISGYADPNNKGAAFVDLSPYDSDDELGAALGADSIAEREAEDARDYNHVWQAGRHFEDLGDEIIIARRACLDLIAQAKAGCKSLADLPAVKGAIRNRIEHYVGSIRNAREKRAELESDYGHSPAFHDA